MLIGDEAIREVAYMHGQYPLEAYLLLGETLAWANIPGHVTGQKLARMIYEYSIEKYGLMASTVWRQLNIHRSEDLGEIVFHLVDAGLLGAQPTDSKSDFDNLLIVDDLDDVSIAIRDDKIVYTDKDE